jgi:hypothetical protein
VAPGERQSAQLDPIHASNCRKYTSQRERRPTGDCR